MRNFDKIFMPKAAKRAQQKIDAEYFKNHPEEKPKPQKEREERTHKKNKPGAFSKTGNKILNTLSTNGKTRIRSGFPKAGLFK